MASAAECRSPSGKCQGIVIEFDIVWRVVSVYNVSSGTSLEWLMDDAVLLVPVAGVGYGDD